MKENHAVCQKRSGRKTFFRRYINGTKGVISLFLAILMVPFVSIAGILINAARVNSAIAIFDEALCNASNSTLGTYDQFLKERFGLLAMAQNTAAGGNSYTVQNLISDTFQFYMEQNLGVLSNTYTTAEYSAAGVYPLTDTDVLLAEVMEYGKYTVPTKMIIDGLSIDTILRDLTKSASLMNSFFNLGSSGANMATSFDSCQEKMNSLTEKLKACETLQGETDSNYSDFSGAVTTYNAKVEEMKQEVAKCDKEVAAAEAALAAADEDSYASARARLDAAKKKRQETIDKYHEELIPLRASVESSKNSYEESLAALAESVKEAGEATTAAQGSINSAIKSGTDFAKSVVDTVGEGKKSAIDKNTETMKAYKEAADEAGNSEASYLWEQQIKENNAAKVESGNKTTLIKEGITAGSEAAQHIDDFAGREYQEDYSQIHSAIVEMYCKVAGDKDNDGYVVVKTDDPMEDTAAYYQDFGVPLTSDEVEALLDDLGDEIAKSSFFEVLKAIVGFIKAMFTMMDLWANQDLCANVTGSAYSSIGGLPSQKTSQVSAFQEEDKQQSEYYKSIMGAYSINGLNTSSVSGFEATILALQEDINTISEAWDDIKWYNVLFKLGEIAGAVGSMGGHLASLIGQIQTVIQDAVYEKVLLAGYIGYNTANRTTYSGRALTGASYDLPGIETGDTGIAFYGAETEYIIIGDSSEISNQTMLFHIVYVLRLIINIPTVVVNSEVAAIAESVGAATFGIGAFVVYALYFLAEPLVDTMILVNGGELPIIKTKAYLTPSGIFDMVSAMISLKMTDGQKEAAYQEVVRAVNKLGGDDTFAKSYADASATSGASKFVSGFKIDYTQTLILIMLFINTESMLKRLGDIIQMEASYQASQKRIDTYNFDLDQSYTYLRASGSFQTNEFIRLSDTGELNSTQRVVYRGY